MSVSKKYVGLNDETKLALLEQSITHIDKMLFTMQTDSKTTKVEVNQYYEKISQKFVNLDTKIEKLDIKMQDNFRWTLGVVITLFSGLYATALGGMIARLCHWI